MATSANHNLFNDPIQLAQASARKVIHRALPREPLSLNSKGELRDAIKK